LFQCQALIHCGVAVSNCLYSLYDMSNKCVKELVDFYVCGGPGSIPSRCGLMEDKLPLGQIFIRVRDF
jgi:hypothetical protein